MGCVCPQNAPARRSPSPHAHSVSHTRSAPAHATRPAPARHRAVYSRMGFCGPAGTVKTSDRPKIYDQHEDPTCVGNIMDKYGTNQVWEYTTTCIPCKALKEHRHPEVQDDGIRFTVARADEIKENGTLKKSNETNAEFNRPQAYWSKCDRQRQNSRHRCRKGPR